MAGEAPDTPPGIGSPVLGGLRGDMSEGEGVSPIPSFEVSTPVTYAPPGWDTFQDPPVLPKSDPKAFPIGGGENVSKLFSHIV